MNPIKQTDQIDLNTLARSLLPLKIWRTLPMSNFTVADRALVASAHATLTANGTLTQAQYVALLGIKDKWLQAAQFAKQKQEEEIDLLLR